MLNVNNIKINFSNKNYSGSNSGNIINILFFDKNKKLINKPSWLTQQTIKFINKTIKNPSLKDFSIIRSEYGCYLLVKDFYKNKDEMNNLDIENLGGKVFGIVHQNNFKNVEIYLEEINFSCNLLFGFLLSSYSFNNFKSSKNVKNTLNINFISENFKKIKKLFNEYQSICKGVFFTRDLVWKPANLLYPKIFTEECKKLIKQGVKVSIFNEEKLKKIGMNALLAVGQGSSKSSYVVVLEWKGTQKTKSPLAFIGKGVCFDSGGLSLKPAKSMEDMKWDMGGAAVVTGLMDAVSNANLKNNVIGVLGLVENMPDGNSQRPGDVVKSISGKTIEVLNTDAEGRLVLADLLSWTEKKFKPNFMINLATLTGAMIVSLGNVRAGMFSNNKNLIKQIEISSSITGDKVWNMPLDDEYDKMLDTEIADMKNIGGLGAGAITAACFLKRHINKTAWAHLDIAGVTWSKKSTPTSPAGASGWGVKLLFDLVKNFDYKI